LCKLSQEENRPNPARPLQPHEGFIWPASTVGHRESSAFYPSGLLQFMAVLRPSYEVATDPIPRAAKYGEAEGAALFEVRHVTVI
jgi:hypothetical protein